MLIKFLSFIFDTFRLNYFLVELFYTQYFSVKQICILFVLFNKLFLKENINFEKCIYFITVVKPLGFERSSRSGRPRDADQPVLYSVCSTPDRRPVPQVEHLNDRSP